MGMENTRQRETNCDITPPPLRTGATRAVRHRKGRGGGRSGGLKGLGTRTGGLQGGAHSETQAAMVDQGTQAAMTDHGTQAAMADPGTQAAMADPGT